MDVPPGRCPGRNKCVYEKGIFMNMLINEYQ